MKMVTFALILSFTIATVFSRISISDVSRTSGSTGRIAWHTTKTRFSGVYKDDKVMPKDLVQDGIMVGVFTGKSPPGLMGVVACQEKLTGHGKDAFRSLHTCRVQGISPAVFNYTMRISKWEDEHVQIEFKFSGMLEGIGYQDYKVDGLSVMGTEIWYPGGAKVIKASIESLARPVAFLHSKGVVTCFKLLADRLNNNLRQQGNTIPFTK
eukprot:gene6231-10237_t